MEQYKQEFIDFLLNLGSLKVGGDFKLKSGRFSPYFIDIGNVNDGISTARLGELYAEALVNASQLEHKISLDYDNFIYGIPEKGIAPAITTSIALSSRLPPSY